MSRSFQKSQPIKNHTTPASHHTSSQYLNTHQANAAKAIEYLAK